ncbi:MAG: hypothetical protein ACM3S1_02350 [Hyphomicrobiales bacterium]
MSEPNPLDDLLNAWKKFSDDYLVSFRRAFESSSKNPSFARSFGAAWTSPGEPRSAPQHPGASANGEPRKPDNEPGDETEFGEAPIGPSPAGAQADGLAALRERIDGLDERLRRIETLLESLAADGEDEDDGEAEAAAVDLDDAIAELEYQVDRLKKRAKKGKRKKK